jgi:hypothetical protein
MTWVRSRIAGGFFWRPFYRYFVFRKSARKLDLFRKFVFIMLHSVRAADVAATREKSTESQVDAGRDFRISKIERDLAGAADTGNEIDSRFSNGKLTYIGIKSMRSRPERERRSFSELFLLSDGQGRRFRDRSRSLFSDFPASGASRSFARGADLYR